MIIIDWYRRAFLEPLAYWTDLHNCEFTGKKEIQVWLGVVLAVPVEMYSPFRLFGEKIIQMGSYFLNWHPDIWKWPFGYNLRLCDVNLRLPVFFSSLSFEKNEGKTVGSDLGYIFTTMIYGPVKAETHDATNCCDASPRQVAATNRLVWHVKSLSLRPNFVAAICRTNSNWFEFVRHIAATN